MPAIRAVATRVLEDPANPQLLVLITADDGSTGLGECWWGVYRPELPAGAPVRPIQAVIDELLAPVCLGRDADDIDGVWQAMEAEMHQYGAGISRAAMSGVDIALWDGRARRAGVPVADLLGGEASGAVPGYASLDWLGSEAAVRRDAGRAIATGFTGVKLHDRDPHLVAAARDGVGPDVAVMVDASSGFEVDGAVAASRRYAEQGVAWLEEPVFPPRDHAALARVRAAAAVPVAAGENEYTLGGFTRLLDAGAVDIVQPEIAKFGGFTPARGVAALAAARGVPLCPHNYSMGPSFYASLQWAVAIRAPWLEVPFLSPGAGFPLGLPSPPFRDGRIVLPDAPGLGLPERVYDEWG